MKFARAGSLFLIGLVSIILIWNGFNSIAVTTGGQCQKRTSELEIDPKSTPLNIERFDYTFSSVSNPAFRVGSEVRTFPVYSAADERFQDTAGAYPQDWPATQMPPRCVIGEATDTQLGTAGRYAGDRTANTIDPTGAGSLSNTIKNVPYQVIPAGAFAWVSAQDILTNPIGRMAKALVALMAMMALMSFIGLGLMQLDRNI